MAKKLGVILIIISFVLWVFILGIPWLEIDAALKAGIITVFVVLGEVFFWCGTVLAGKDIVKKYMRSINPIKRLRRK